LTADLHLLEVADFQPLLNQTLYIHFSPDIKMAATLIQVTELNGYSMLNRKPFSFVLLTENKMHFPQSTYIIEHPVKGELPVFLVPVGIEDNRMKYEAVFS
jgi:hypothetical protein